MRKRIGKIKSETLAKCYRRKLAIRAKIIGNSEKPRLCAIKSNKHLSVQVVNDQECKTLFSLNTFGKKAVPGSSGTISGAEVLGQKLAEELKKRGFNSAVFDRNGKPYTGVLESLVKGIRENGIEI
jgi:large subunit ribosomal protein L18